ncbi:tRNA guanosine(34) transglycosylase Tgt [Patescibacteria group bacterium]|nr:tRNA guanosine(34) transglycosylase Tgt [Patescibacteria group bacterium]
MYKVLNKKGKARRGTLQTAHGLVETPCFMPIATKGNVKAISVEDLKKLDPAVILGNTYHLMLRPGEEEIAQLGGMHRLMNWRKPILTDSGGFQVFSLAKIRKLNEEGVIFNSHINGKEFFLSPENAINIQFAIGSDIMMVLDECVKLPAERKYLLESVEMTTRWAKRCKEKFESELEKKNIIGNKPLLFGIVQGGLEKDLRMKSANELEEIGFDGYAIGGLSVGESELEMYEVLDYVAPELPEDKPRYLMGVGYPHQIVEAVKRGIDMFDCVIPTREARHGRLYFMKREEWKMEDSEKFYQTINITSEKFKLDQTPINEKSSFDELKNYSRAYLRNLFVNNDPAAMRLATLNNLEFYLNLMKEIRTQLS